MPQTTIIAITQKGKHVIGQVDTDREAIANHLKGRLEEPTEYFEFILIVNTYSLGDPLIAVERLDIGRAQKRIKNVLGHNPEERTWA